MDNERIREVIVTGLRDYLGIPVIRSNQAALPPDYPYGSYTVTTVATANNGTWQVWNDGIDRLPVTQRWSLTFMAKTDSESVYYALKAREWLQHSGSVYLQDNDVIVQSATGITNRDNVLTTGWEYRNGFDIELWLCIEATNPVATGSVESIESMQLGD